MLIKRLYMLQIINPVLVTTENMIADALTKPLDRTKLAKCRNYMLNQDHGPGTLGALSASARRMLKHLCMLPE